MSQNQGFVPTMDQNQDSDLTNDSFYNIVEVGKPKMTPTCYLTDTVLPGAPKKFSTAPDAALSAAQAKTQNSATRKLDFSGL